MRRPCWLADRAWHPRRRSLLAAGKNIWTMDHVYRMAESASSRCCGTNGFGIPPLWCLLLSSRFWLWSSRWAAAWICVASSDHWPTSWHWLTTIPFHCRMRTCLQSSRHASTLYFDLSAWFDVDDHSSCCRHLASTIPRCCPVDNFSPSIFSSCIAFLLFSSVLSAR